MTEAHLEGVWVLIGVEQEAGADLLGAPGQDFQGPDYRAPPGLRVRKAAELTIADFFSCRERMTHSRTNTQMWGVTAAEAWPLPSLGTVRRP